MLNVSHLKKSFGKKSVLYDITFSTNVMELAVVEGRNGAGKSTLFNVLCGLITEDAGSILLNDINLTADPAPMRAKHIAVLRQDPKTSTVGSMNILDNCALALLKSSNASLKNATRDAVKQKALKHLENLGLDYARELFRPLDQFSGGQRQMLAFAIATLHKPALLLLDEPTAALDEDAENKMMELVKRFLQTWAIPAVMISHDHALNRKYADAIYELRDGSLHPIS